MGREGEIERGGGERDERARRGEGEGGREGERRGRKGVRVRVCELTHWYELT